MRKIKFDLDNDLANYLNCKYCKQLVAGGGIRFLQMNDPFCFFLSTQIMYKAKHYSKECPKQGNVTIEFACMECLDARFFCQLSQKDIHRIKCFVNKMMRYELYQTMKESQLRKDVPLLESIIRFKAAHGMKGPSEEALLRGYQRWKKIS